MTSPWERYPAESTHAWQAFVAYRDLGPGRSTAKAAQSLGKSKRTLDDWSSVHSWVARAAAWDAFADAEKRRAFLEAQRQLVHEHAEAAAIVRRKAMVAIEAIKPKKLGPQSAIAWLNAAVKIEQMAVGLPTDRTALEVGAKSSDPLDVFFDTLPTQRLVEIAKEAVQTAEADLLQVAAAESNGSTG